MIKLKLLTLYFALKNFIAPTWIEKKESGFVAGKKGYTIMKVGQLPDSIPESSGLEIARDGESFWTHGDGNCKSNLYEVNCEGSPLSVMHVTSIPNIDWEDMTKDSYGNIYIADTGNNLNKRKNLRILKIHADRRKVDTISFAYPDQTMFPPPKEKMNFDCEAILWYNHHLYLFSKNRGHKQVHFYRIPDTAGVHTATLVDTLYFNSMITSAGISPDKKLVALLGYGKIYFLKAEEGEYLRLKPFFVKPFNRSGQSEGLVFVNNTDMLISNEQGKLFLAVKRKPKN